MSRNRLTTSNTATAGYAKLLFSAIRETIYFLGNTYIYLSQLGFPVVSHIDRKFIIRVRAGEAPQEV